MFYTLLQLSCTCTAAHPSFVDIDADKTIARSIVSSQLDYANALLHRISTSNFDRLQVAQNSLARAMYQATRSASASELCQQLHWLPIRQRVTYKIAVITYKIRSTGTPAYLPHLIRDYLPARTLRSSEQLLLTVPRTMLTLSAKAFSVSVSAP